MISHLPPEAALLVFSIGVALGCSAPRLESSRTGESEQRRPPPGYTIQSKPDMLSPGDTLAVWFFEDAPVKFEPVLVKIADDGTFRFSGGTFWVGGLTPNEAASRIQRQLIETCLGGPVVKVAVMRVQPTGPANGSQTIRSETNRTSGAAGPRR